MIHFIFEVILIYLLYKANKKKDLYYNNYQQCLRELNECLSQQKEFIKYLEDNWKQTQDIWYIKILQKYKEIIGDDK